MQKKEQKKKTEKISEKNIRKSFQTFFEKVKKAKNIFSRVKTRTNQKYSTIFQFQETTTNQKSVLIETVLIEDPRTIIQMLPLFHPKKTYEAFRSSSKVFRQYSQVHNLNSYKNVNFWLEFLSYWTGKQMGWFRSRSQQTLVTEAPSRNVRAFWKLDGDSSRVEAKVSSLNHSQSKLVIINTTQFLYNV